MCFCYLTLRVFHGLWDPLWGVSSCYLTKRFCFVLSLLKNSAKAVEGVVKKGGDQELRP